MSQRPNYPPFLHTWIAGNGRAAQVLLCDGPEYGYFECLKPRPAGEPRHRVMCLDSENELRRNPACRDGLYAPSRSQHRCRQRPWRWTSYSHGTAAIKYIASERTARRYSPRHADLPAQCGSSPPQSIADAFGVGCPSALILQALCPVRISASSELLTATMNRNPPFVKSLTWSQGG